MADSVAERSRRFHARRRASAEQELRDAYEQRKELLAKEKVRTLPHFRQWTRQLRLDTGAYWVLEPFQSAFVRDLFAGRPQNWLIVPEGNAKTTLVAGLALYHLQYTLDALIAAGAASREQAGVMYDQAEGFIERARDDGVEDFDQFELHPGYRSINYLTTRSKLQIKAADHNTGDGIIPTLCLVDELHRHKDLRLYRTWRGKLEKRQGQIIVISTAGEPGSEFEIVRERIRHDALATAHRRAGFLRAANDAIVLHEWAVPEDGDVEDMRVVKKANPLKAITVPSLRAKFSGPEMTLDHWRRLTCNIPRRGGQAAISERQWEGATARDNDGMPINPIAEGERVWLGLDVAWKWDTTAAVPFLFKSNTERLFGPALVVTPPRDGSTLDPAIVKRGLIVLHQRNPIHTVVMDMSDAADLAAWIVETLGCEVLDRSQSPAAAVEDYSRFMEALGNGWLQHSGDQGLTRHALNAIAKMTPYGDTRFDRPAIGRNSDQERRVVDALTAASMVHTEATRAPVDERSAYEDDARRILI